MDPNDIQALKDEIEDLQIDLRKAEEEEASWAENAQAQSEFMSDYLAYVELIADVLNWYFNNSSKNHSLL